LRDAQHIAAQGLAAKPRKRRVKVKKNILNKNRAGSLVNWRSKSWLSQAAREGCFVRAASLPRMASRRHARGKRLTASRDYAGTGKAARKLRRESNQTGVKMNHSIADRTRRAPREKFFSAGKNFPKNTPANERRLDFSTSEIVCQSCRSTSKTTLQSRRIVLARAYQNNRWGIKPTTLFSRPMVGIATNLSMTIAENPEKHLPCFSGLAIFTRRERKKRWLRSENYPDCRIQFGIQSRIPRKNSTLLRILSSVPWHSIDTTPLQSDWRR